MNCIGCGNLVDRDGTADKVCSSCRTALVTCKKEGLRPQYVVSSYFTMMRAANTLRMIFEQKEIIG